MQSVPSPRGDAPAKNSFFHKAANYAVVVIPLGWALNWIFFSTFLSGAARTQLPMPISMALGLLPGLLAFSAVPAGIIALCGIPKHGPAKLLWKGLVGVIVPMGLAAWSFSNITVV